MPRLSTEELEAFEKEEDKKQYKKTVDMAMSIIGYTFIEHRNRKANAMIATEASIMAATAVASTFILACPPSRRAEATHAMKRIFTEYLDSFLEKADRAY